MKISLHTNKKAHLPKVLMVLSKAILVSLWFSSITATAETNRILKELERQCSSTTHNSNQISVLTYQKHTDINLLYDDNNSFNDRFIERWRFSVDLVNSNLENYVEDPVFKVVKGKSNEAVPLNCRQLSATNIYYHLNLAHSYFHGYLNKIPQLFDHLQYPITIRLDMDTKFHQLTKFTEDPFHNNVSTYSGWAPESNNYQFMSEYEIWFFKPKRTMRPTRSFLCLLKELKNSSLCSSVQSVDYSLNPKEIFHEYIHLLTAYHIHNNIRNIVGEGYSIFFEDFLMQELIIKGRNDRDQYFDLLPQTISPHRLSKKQTRFWTWKYKSSYDEFIPKKIPPQKKLNFIPTALNSLYLKLLKQLSKERIIELFLNSMYYLKSVEEGKNVKTKHIPYALLKACSTTFKLDELETECKSQVTKWKNKLSFPEIGKGKD